MSNVEKSNQSQLDRRRFLRGSIGVSGGLLIPVGAGAWSLAAGATGGGIINTVVGGGAVRSGLATTVAISSPFSLSVDAADNVYICDNYYHRIYMVNATTGVLTPVAGTGIPGKDGDEGLAVNASLCFPYGIACDASGSLCIADTGNERVRWVDKATGLITLLAGGGSDASDGVPANTALLRWPFGVAIDKAGNVYIADSDSMRIRVVNRGPRALVVYPDSPAPIVIQPGDIATVAGNMIPGFGGDGGPATAAKLNNPWGIAFDSLGNLHIADYYNHRIRKVDRRTGIISTVAGTGIAGSGGDGQLATAARISNPCTIAFDRAGNLYIGQQQTSRVRKVDVSTRIISTVAGLGGQGEGGDGGPAVNARLSSPTGVAVDSAANLYIAEYNNARVRRVAAVTQIISTYAGGSTNVGDGGSALQATLNQPCAFSFGYGSQQGLILSDQMNHTIRAVDATGKIRRVAGTGVSGYNGDGIPARQAQIFMPCDVQADTNNNIYICDRGNQRIRKVDASNKIISTVAGNGQRGYGGDGGPATAALVNEPRALTLDVNGNLYIAELHGMRIRFVNLGQAPVTLYAGSPYALTIQPGTIITVAGTGVSDSTGDGGPAVLATVNSPRGITTDAKGDLFITEGGLDPQNIPPPEFQPSSKLRKINSRTGIITTVAGTGTPGYNGDDIPATQARLDGPRNAVVDSVGNIYIADSLNNRVRYVDAHTGIITTFLGAEEGGFSGDGGPVALAEVCLPRYVGMDPTGNLYVTDIGNSRIRMVANPHSTR
jgi:sugar lactone lactonase YvrE